MIGPPDAADEFRRGVSLPVCGIFRRHSPCPRTQTTHYRATYHPLKVQGNYAYPAKSDTCREKQAGQHLLTQMQACVLLTPWHRRKPKPKPKRKHLPSSTMPAPSKRTSPNSVRAWRPASSPSGRRWQRRRTSAKSAKRWPPTKICLRFGTTCRTVNEMHGFESRPCRNAPPRTRHASPYAKNPT